MNRLLPILLLAVVASGAAADSIGDFQYRKVSSVSIRADGPVDEPLLLDLVEVTPEVDILTTSKIRRSIELLYATGNFTNILVDAKEDGDRVALTFILRLVYRFRYVHLHGDLGVSRGAIRKRLQLRKLEPYTPEKVLQGREEILKVLRENGYYEARVTQDVLLQRKAKRAEVNYEIHAGQPAHTGSVSFSGDPFYSEETLRNVMKSEPGKRFRESEFRKDLERIEAHYDKNGFLEHAIRVAKEERDAQNRMQLELNIQAGKQLLLEIEGYSLSDEIIQEQIPIRVDRSYNDDTLEEGKRNLSSFMQKQGYYDASVEWEKVIDQEKILITFRIRPGTLYEISEIRIQGNEHFPKKEILDLMKTRKSTMIKGGRLVTRSFESDMNSILAAYRERGFLFASLARKEVIRAPEGKLILDLEIREEQRVMVAEIRMKGNEVIPTEFFLERFEQKAGMPVSESKVKNDSNYIVALYSDKGFPKIKMENRILLSTDKSRAAIEYRIEEGEQVFVDRIVLSGNYRTRRNVITQNLFFAEDDPLSLRKIQESQSKLYSLQIFDRVDMQLPRPDSLHKYQEVILKLTESRPYTISYGIGFETHNKLRGVFTITNRNLFGTARSGSLQLRGGFEEGRVLFNYSDPLLFSRRTLSTLSVFLERRSPRESFSYRSYGTRIGVEKKLSPEPASLEIGRSLPPQKSIFFGYRFEDIDTDGTPSISPEDRQFLAIHLSAPSASFARDARDNAIDPTKGSFFSTELEWSTSLLGSETDYIKSFTWLQYYSPLKWTVAASSFRLGMAHGYKDTVRLPLSQRFFAGGGRTIRGFDLDTAGPLDENEDPLGGNMMFILNLENRFPIYKNLGGVVFFDWGNVFDLISSFSLGGLRETAGLGVRYKTAIGPASFDWGYKLDRRPGESAYEFYLSIGNAF